MLNTLLRAIPRVLVLTTSLFLPHVWAGTQGDAWGQIQRVQIAADGKLWFAMGTAPATTYCKEGWANLNLFVPKDHPEYPYYYAMLVTAVSKGKSVLVANLDMFDGTGPCDITKTGYGLVLLQ